MLWQLLKHQARRFRDDTNGTIMVETVLTLPILFWALIATFEFFEVHRYKSAREKATYTVADMLSRENDVITDVYVDNAKALFDEISNDGGINQLRVSIVNYDADDDEFAISWSEVRGIGSMNVLTDSDVVDSHDDLPSMNDGEELILVESISSYEPYFDLVFSDAIGIETRVFTTIRFAPKLCFDECTSS